MQMDPRFGTKANAYDVTPRTVFNYITDTLLWPFRIAISKPARRVYLTTILLFISASILLGIATIGYIVFYWSYIPRVGFERTLHLQFDYVSQLDPAIARAGAAVFSQYPHASVPLSPDFVSAQGYDVVIELKLPRTRENRNAGNFMIEATMLAAESVVDTVKEGFATGSVQEDNNKLAVSRRSAMLKYRSFFVESLWKLTELHWYLLGFREEADTVRVSVFEGIEFPKGWRNVPSTMRVEIQSVNRMQIYSAKALFRARFRGLRWLMYKHRVISAMTFITFFWFIEILFAALVWAAISLYLGQGSSTTPLIKEDDSAVKVKEEAHEDEQPVLSDTDRTFPTTSKQTPLRYQSPKIKSESEEIATMAIPESSTRATEADDEDDDELDSFRDSGLGTGLESSSTRLDSIRRRRSRFGSSGK